MKIINSELLKTASLPSLSIEEWRFGPVLVIEGNTYNIKDRLKTLGFKPYQWKKSWVQIMDKSKFDKKLPDEKISFISALKQENIQNLNILLQTNTSTPTINPITEPKTEKTSPKSEILQGEEYPYKNTMMNNEKEEKTRSKYSFPIAKNILQLEMNINIDGELHKEIAWVSRTFTPGKTSDTYNVKFDREYKNFPTYEISIGQKTDGNPILTIRITTKGKITQRPWGSYDERAYLTEELKPKIEQAIQNKVSYQKTFKNEYDKEQRDPKFSEFLQEITYSWDKQHSLYELTIAEGPYAGSYPVAIYYMEPQEIVMETSLNHPLSPRKITLGRFELIGIQNMDDLNKTIQQKLSDPNIQQEYIKYLKSFPFLSDQTEKETTKFEEIKNFIMNKSVNIDNVMRKIKEMGYIRPHKRQKQTGPGMTSGEEIKWVLDANAIRDGIYGRGFHKSSPDFFYTVIAYYVLKAKTGQWSWSDIILIGSIRDWIGIMKKFGQELNFSEIEKTISAIGKEILYMVFGQKSNTRSEQFYDFYYGGGFFGDEKTKGYKSNYSAKPALEQLENFSKQLGLEPQGMNIKQIYRSLSRMTHPDLNPNNPLAEENFKKLQSIWDNIPDDVKQANNWYDKITVG